MGVQIPRLPIYLVFLCCFPHWTTSVGYLRSVFILGKSPGDWVHWGADIVCTMNGVMSYCCLFFCSIIGCNQTITYHLLLYCVGKCQNRKQGDRWIKGRTGGETRKYHIKFWFKVSAKGKMIIPTTIVIYWT